MTERTHDIRSFQELLQTAEESVVNEGVTISAEVEDILADYMALVTSRTTQRGAPSSDYLESQLIRKGEQGPVSNPEK